ncbi:MAG: phosphoribosylanthranilate isomerase [Aeoliella sp.]
MQATPFRIKICGITTWFDARGAASAGADAIGLTFYEQSPRCILPTEAQKIARDKEDATQRIGVFVNADLESIRNLCEEDLVDAVQLHGDEPPEFVAKLQGQPVIRARRIDDRGVAAIAEDLAACKAAGRLPDAVLVDAMTPGRYGGTGETVSWAGLADYRRWLGDVPLILAGGLTPENVAEAIRIVRPDGVDVASGVEKSPGVKDARLVEKFIAAARLAFC